MELLVFVLMALSAVNCKPAEPTTTSRSQDVVKKPVVELLPNSTSDVMLDTRTPPKIKQHAKKKPKPTILEEIENSHAGVAIPMEEDEIHLEETTKKLNFYKVERPTTTSGLSTWILLSGSSTPKPTRKPIVKPAAENATIATIEKVVKPLFKKRITSTTRKPSSTTTVESTQAPVSTTKLIKIKASLLNSATTKKLSTTTTPQTPTTSNKTILETNSTVTNSSNLPMEAKDGDTELEDKKTRRPVNKRKKNKNRRRRPAQEKVDNSTKLIPAKSKEKPIGTQLYNYLSREVMPTVGVGLVGLMVTAGLASYFLYPFGIAKRSYEIDRKDKEGSYYYSDEYSGGIAEEEAIGKVIAGMPTNSVYGNSYKTPTSRNSFNNNNWNRQNTYEQSKETGYTVDGRFVVGNTPKVDVITPAAVPEHGPRSLKLRKKRQLDQENEIPADYSTTTTTPVSATESGTTSRKPEIDNRVSSFVSLFRDLFNLKIRLGLQLLQNATQAVSKYVSHVQRRLDNQAYNTTMTVKN